MSSTLFFFFFFIIAIGYLLVRSRGEVSGSLLVVRISGPVRLEDLTRQSDFKCGVVLKNKKSIGY